jgi:hypothetical protein
MELELKASHHRDLLQGNAAQYERVAASVLQDLLGPGYDVMKITIAELYYYFFMAKASTLGPAWKFPWECTHTVIKNSVETSCGHKNIAVYDISKLTPTQIPADYKLPTHTLVLKKVGKVDPGTERPVEVSLHPLSLQEEFDVIDYFLSQGISREDLFKTQAYNMQFRRVAYGLRSDDPTFSSASVDDKVELINLNSMDLIKSLMRELTILDKIGYKQESIGECSGCHRKVTLRLPFLAGLVVHD